MPDVGFDEKLVALHAKLDSVEYDKLFTSLDGMDVKLDILASELVDVQLELIGVRGEMKLLAAEGVGGLEVAVESPRRPRL